LIVTFAPHALRTYTSKVSGPRPSTLPLVVTATGAVSSTPLAGSGKVTVESAKAPETLWNRTVRVQSIAPWFVASRLVSRK
jgi:hypothetical protein